MRLVRTFHPIGQGAFYTEVFFENGVDRFVAVYDCGTETANTVMDVSFWEQIFNFKCSISPKPQIDILFISHFHADHINGLNKLLAGVKAKKTVIPMLDWPTFIITRLGNYLSLYNSNPELTLEIDQIIRELYLNEGNSNRFGEIVMVSPNTADERIIEEEVKNGIVGYGSQVLSGSRIPYKNLWEYVTFNSITFNDPRAQSLLNNLMQIDGVTSPMLLNLENLIRNHLDEVKKEYKKVIRNANDNLYTLIVESRPTKDVIPQPRPRLSHCMYFGDFDCKQNSVLWSRFNKVFNYEEVGTVQVPHHGAKGNWRNEMGQGDPRHYIVSTGSTNGHHHPNYWVLLDIWQNGHRPYVVSERLATGKEYEFEV